MFLMESIPPRSLPPRRWIKNVQAGLDGFPCLGHSGMDKLGSSALLGYLKQRFLGRSCALFAIDGSSGRVGYVKRVELLPGRKMVASIL